MSARNTAMICVLVLLSACDGGKGGSSVTTYPELDLTVTRLDFERVAWGDSRTRQFKVTNLGDLPMGIESIALGEGEMEGSFSLSYSEDNIDCGGSEAEEAARIASSVSPDTGSEIEDTGDEEASATESGVIVLNAGCSLPVQVTMSPVTVGEIVSSVRVTTVDGESGGTEFYQDPDNQWKLVILEGKGEKSGGNLITSPLNLDFGYVYTGEIGTEYVRVRNVGDMELILGEPELDPTCSAAWTITSAFEEGRVLDGDSSTLIEVSFSPIDDEAESCSLVFTSDDEDEPVVEVSMQANTGDDPENVAPTAEIRSPDPGHVHSGPQALELEINVFDVDQPADTLDCAVKSVVLLNETLADCTPTDESGHVIVEIDTTELESGVDTLLVVVEDSSGAYAYASTTYLYKEGYPGSDDDGDGFGDDATEENVDCDDEDINVYPEGAERADGKDNDCNGTTDEGTAGADDDGDGVSEDDGDCNDNDDNTYPGAPELGDRADNDCDGTTDEGSSLYDDDGDDFSEAENDCDDDDPAINPTADEYCDGEDNDCNGLKDEQDGCISLESDPIIVGGIQMAVTALGVGESTTMTVYAFDGDSDSLIYAWEQDPSLSAEGYTSIDNPIASTVTFTAPSSLAEGSKGEIYTMSVVVLDEDGNSDYALGDIVVFPDPVDLEVSYSSSGGCGGGGSDTGEAGLLLLPGLAGLGLLRRRRRQA